tara:strand:- start:5942 stop:6811 length:870 start_codon:yes stop_codon:yes gene_type:complete
MHIVTGAAGFIGSNLVAHLNKQGHNDVLLVDNLSMEKTKNLAHLRFEDMISPSELLEMNIDKSDTVWHMGANSSTKETDWDKIYSSNVDYTRRLISKCNTMVFASSASVYGDNISTQEHPVNEAPKNLYASSKLICDNIFRNTVGCKIQSWRFFNVYGNRESHKQAVGMGSPYTNFVKQAKDTGVIKIFEGSDKVQRDFVCIDDVVHVMYKCLQHDESFICNLGTGTTYTFEYWAKLIASHYNAVIEYIPVPDDLKGIYQMYTCSDNTQLDTLINHDFKSPDQFVEENL